MGKSLEKIKKEKLKIFCSERYEVLKKLSHVCFYCNKTVLLSSLKSHMKSKTCLHFKKLYLETRKEDEPNEYQIEIDINDLINNVLKEFYIKKERDKQFQKEKELREKYLSIKNQLNNY